jgi:hypothetical protein
MGLGVLRPLGAQGSIGAHKKPGNLWSLWGLVTSVELVDRWGPMDPWDPGICRGLGTLGGLGLLVTQASLGACKNLRSRGPLGYLLGPWGPVTPGAKGSMGPKGLRPPGGPGTNRAPGAQNTQGPD